MKTLILTSTALLSTHAMAHAGAHTQSLMATIGHWFSQPDHLLMSAAAVVTAAVVAHHVKAKV